MNDETAQHTLAMDAEHGVAPPPEGARQRTNDGQVHPRSADVATIKRPGEGDGATAGAPPPATDETGVTIEPEPPARPVRRPRFRDRPRTWWVTVPPARQPPVQRPDEAAAAERAPDTGSEHVRHDDVLGAPTGAPQTGRRPPFRSRRRTWWVQALFGEHTGYGRLSTAASRSLADMGVPTVLLAGLTISLTIVFRSYRVDALPGEFYGDITIIYEYINNVLRGHWPFHFVLSTGPLYGYLVSPIILLLGQQGYLPYKVASIVVSCIGIFLTYLLARRVADLRIALLTGLILATSSWYLVFSRLGNAQIAIPALVAASFCCLAWGVDRKNLTLPILGAVVASLGLYTMPQAFILPFVYLVVSAFYFPLRRLVPLCCATLIASVPALMIIVSQQNLFFSPSGYVGGKIGGHNLAWKIVDNAIKSLPMLHVKGDAVFRSNPSGMPQLDPISGVLFLLGIIFWSAKSRRRWLPLLLIPFFLLQIPSILVLSEVSPTPSASRTIGILPFVAVLISGGIQYILNKLNDRRVPKLVYTTAIIGSIVLLNWNRYFDSYAEGLPNHNTPIGKIIAQEIDQLAANVSVSVVGCCWGEWSQPEPKGITDVVNPPRDIRFIPENEFQCRAIPSHGSVYVVFPPDMGPRIKAVAACLGPGELRSHTDQAGNVIFYSFSTGAAELVSPSATRHPSPAVGALPAAFICGPRSRRSLPAGGKAVRLESLPAACGCPRLVTPHHPASWHGHSLSHGLQLTGTCALAVLRLDKQYDHVAGTIYVDDATGTTGGIITLYDAVVPTDSSTYRTLFEHNIGFEKDHRVSLQTSVRGVEYLAVWERCCTMQNTVFDVVAIVTARAHP